MYEEVPKLQDSGLKILERTANNPHSHHKPFSYHCHLISVKMFHIIKNVLLTVQNGYLYRQRERETFLADHLGQNLTILWKICASTNVSSLNSQTSDWNSKSFFNALTFRQFLVIWSMMTNSKKTHSWVFKFFCPQWRTFRLRCIYWVTLSI